MECASAAAASAPGPAVIFENGAHPAKTRLGWLFVKMGTPVYHLFRAQLTAPGPWVATLLLGLAMALAIFCAAARPPTAEDRDPAPKKPCHRSTSTVPL